MMPVTAEQIDRAAMLAHLQWITRRWPELGEPAYIELRALGEDLTPLSSRFSVDPMGLDLAVDYAAGLNAIRGRNIYPVMNPLRDTKGRSAQDGDVIASIFHWADADKQEAIDRLKAWGGPKWRAVVKTGSIPHDRVHVYWELAEWQRDLAAWRATQQAIAARFLSDGAVINPSRIMRLAGTISWPSDKKLARGYVSEVATLRTWADRELVDSATFARAFGTVEAQQPSGFQFDTGEQYAPSLDRERAAIAAMSGMEWHNNVIRLVASYVSRGLSDAEIIALTEPLTLPGYTVEQTRREVQTAIEGARRKGWTPEPQQYADPATAWDAADAPQEQQPSKLEWFDDIEPALADAYVVKDLIQQAALSVLYGASNTGKTFFALDLAFAIACGGPWRGRRVNAGSVLYLAAEGGRGAANRIAALRRHTGLCDVPLALRRAGLDLLKNNADLKAVVDLAAETAQRGPLRLIVVDTLSRVMAGGDENAPQDMTALIRNIDAIRAHTGAHVMLVHHSGKDEGRGARGHSSLRAAVDTEIEVVSDDAGRAAFVRKQRDYQGGETFAFSLHSVELGHDQDGDPVVSCVVECADDAEFMAARNASKGIGGTQAVVLETFDQMLAEGLAKPNPGGVGMPEAGQFWAVDAAALKEIARGKLSVSDPYSAVNKAIAALTGKRAVLGIGKTLIWHTGKKVKG